MLRRDAYEAMTRGEKITHELFDDSEFIHMKLNTGAIVDELGNDFDAGWKLRYGGVWNSGWQIFKGKNIERERVILPFEGETIWQRR